MQLLYKMNLATIIKEAFNEDIAQLSEDTQFSSFAEWDSLGHMLFITKLEESFGFEFSGEEIAEITTLAQLKNALAQKGVN